MPVEGGDCQNVGKKARKDCGKLFCGKLWVKVECLPTFTLIFWTTSLMNYLVGEFECKLDTKGRMVLPANLKRKLPEIEQEGFIVNRGLKKHLVLNTRKEFEKTVEKLSQLSEYDSKHDDFLRKFLRGATEVFLDSANRLLLPKNLVDFAGIKTDVVLHCRLHKIEVWAKEAYDQLWEEEDDQFPQLAMEVMGSLSRKSEDG